MNESVARKVGPPGIALALFGLVSIGLHFLGGVANVALSFPAILRLLEADSTAADFQLFVLNPGWQLIWGISGFFASFLVTFAGLRLRSARSAWLIYLGAIAAMFPCCGSACCVLGLPLGVWALVVMQDEQVKAAFSERF